MAAFLVLGLLGCDTFASLDRVQEPPRDDGFEDLGGPADTGDATDATVPADLATDASDGRDTATRDMLTADGGADMPVAVGCPRVGAPIPAWAASRVSLPKATVIASDVFRDISLAANEAEATSAGRFALAFREQVGGVPTGRIDLFEGEDLAGATSVTVFHAVVEPWMDIAVAGTPTANRFAFMAIGENPSCSGTGPLAFHGFVEDGVGVPALDELANESADCGTFRPRAAVTGAHGTPPNMFITSTNFGTQPTLAFPGPQVSGGGSAITDHVSASSKDLVAVSTNQLDRWYAWLPGRPGQGAEIIDFDGYGDLEVEWLFDDCYVAVTPRAEVMKVGTVDCPTDCTVSPATDYSLGAQVSRADVTRMPGGGFVVVAATGVPQERLVAHFFDDGFAPIPVGTMVSVDITGGLGFVSDFSVAATTEGADVLIAVAYTTETVFGQPFADSLSVATMRLAPEP